MSRRIRRLSIGLIARSAFHLAFRPFRPCPSRRAGDLESYSMSNAPSAAIPRQRPSISRAALLYRQSFAALQAQFIRPRGDLLGRTRQFGKSLLQAIQQRDQQLGGVNRVSGGVAKRGHAETDFSRRFGRGVVRVDADADHLLAVGQGLNQDTGQLATIQHHVVGPVNADLMARNQRAQGIDQGHADRQRNQDGRPRRGPVGWDELASSQRRPTDGRGWWAVARLRLACPTLRLGATDRRGWWAVAT